MGAQVYKHVEQRIKEICPRFYEEYIGTLKRLEAENSHMVVFLTCASGNSLKLIFPANSPEADLLKNQLNSSLVGTKLGILKTDNPERPILIRIIKPKNG